MGVGGEGPTQQAKGGWTQRQLGRFIQFGPGFVGLFDKQRSEFSSYELLSQTTSLNSKLMQVNKNQEVVWLGKLSWKNEYCLGNKHPP